MSVNTPQAVPTQALSRRVGGPLYGLAGQFLNAGTNVVTAYVASFLLSPDAFGSFVLAFAGVTVVLATGRGLLGSTIVVHLPAQEPAARAALVRSALGFALLLGVVVSVVLALVGGVLLWFAPWITFALLQDVGRYVYLADGRTGAAFALDLVWAIAQATLLLGWLLAGGSVGVGLLVTAWGVGALVGFVLFAIKVDARPATPRPWMRATRDVAGWFTAVAVLGAAEIYAVLQLTTALLGSAEAGGLRAAQLLAYQPAMVVAGALMVMLTPAAVRARASRTELIASARRIALMMAPLVGLLGLVALLHGPLIALLFPRYTAFAPLVVPIALQAIVVVLGAPPAVILRALRRGPAVFVAQGLRLVLLIGAGVVGALLGGAVGLAWALVAATVLATLQISVRAAVLVHRDVTA